MGRRHVRRHSPILQWGLYGLLAIALAWAVVTTATMWEPMISYLCAVNLVTLVFYGIDKSRAQSGSARIPEIVLLALVALGGSPLGLVARYWFRHKTKKTSFRIKFWVIVLAQAVVIGAYLILRG